MGRPGGVAVVMRAAAALALAVLLAGCGIEEDVDPPAPAEDRPERSIAEFVLTETSGGALQWRLHAEEADYFRAAGETRLRVVDIEFYDEEGRVDSRLTSDRGLVLDETGDMIALGNVRLRSTAGDTLETEELRYVKKDNLVLGPDFVRIAKPDRVLTGRGFRSRHDLSEYEIEREVKVVIVDRPGSARDGG